jgi:lysozyme family protein
MIENWDKSFLQLMEREGGFSNDPRDPGGMTNLGVTKKSWEKWVKHPVDEAEMRSLTHEKVKPFYKANYWDLIKGDELPSGIDYLTFDFAVNAGIGTSSKLLQRAVGVPDDGAIGAKTLEAVAKHDPKALLTEFSSRKAKYYEQIVLNHPEQQTFLKGWNNRIAAVQHTVEGMV